MAEKPIGFVFNQQLLTMVLGVIALSGSIFAGVTWINDRGHFEETTKTEIVALDTKVDTNAAAQTVANEKLAGEVGRLSDSVDELALTLKEVEVIQRHSGTTVGQVTAVPNLR